MDPIVGQLLPPDCTGMAAATMICTSAAPAASYVVSDGNIGLAAFSTASVALIFVFSRIETDDWLDNAKARQRSAALQATAARSAPPSRPPS